MNYEDLEWDWRATVGPMLDIGQRDGELRC